MQSNDARMLMQCAVPTALAGAVAAVVSGVVAGGEGAIGAVVGAVIVILFMGIGVFALQRTARSLPHLFQAMGLLLYTTQILAFLVVLLVLRDSTLFNGKALAFTLLASTLVWVAAQARATMKSKILYVEPEPSAGGAKGEKKAAATGAGS
ncbi:hypothetical protein ACWGJ2_09880 [Streptomyces sp. NPDC054796]|uniref:ATP synthase protein I n=1 Tax=Streptomyces daliensis TaxID=299421 RepID=A0A8T4IND7_9ACTN|nr:hypothetical protein [Streptomyces daliensis]